MPVSETTALQTPSETGNYVSEPTTEPETTALQTPSETGNYVSTPTTEPETTALQTPSETGNYVSTPTTEPETTALQTPSETGNYVSTPTTEPETTALQTLSESGNYVSEPTTEPEPYRYDGQQSAPSTVLQRAEQDRHRESSSGTTIPPKKSRKILLPRHHKKTSADEHSKVFDTGENIPQGNEVLPHQYNEQKPAVVDLSKKEEISLEKIEECRKTEDDQKDEESSTATEQTGINIRPGSTPTVPEEENEIVSKEEKLLQELLERYKIPDPTVEEGRKQLEDAFLRHVKAGDIVEIPKRLYSHFVLYLGLGLVIHYSGDGTILHYLRDPFNKASVKIDAFSSVVKGYNAKLNNDKDAEYRPFPAEEILRRAFEALGRGDYNAFSNNCEHFVSELRYGTKVSCQVDRAKKVCCLCICH